MAEFPAMPLWTDAYLGDTTHLTTLEHGAYLLLLMTAWRSKEGDLPDDDKLLARYCRLGPKQWAAIREVLASFHKIENGRWKQLRLKDELVAVKQRSNRQTRKVRARWLKIKETASTTVIPDAYRSHTSLNHTHTTISKKESPPTPSGFLDLDGYEFQQYRKNCPSLSDDEVKKVIEKADLMFYADGGKNWPQRLIGILKAAETEKKKNMPKKPTHTLDDIRKARGLDD